MNVTVHRAGIRLLEDAQDPVGTILDAFKFGADGRSIELQESGPQSDRLIRAPFNNGDYGRHTQTPFCLRPERLSAGEGAGL